jgi:hypothetical protein
MKNLHPLVSLNLMAASESQLRAFECTLSANLSCHLSSIAAAKAKAQKLRKQAEEAEEKAYSDLANDLQELWSEEELLEATHKVFDKPFNNSFH